MYRNLTDVNGQAQVWEIQSNYSSLALRGTEASFPVWRHSGGAYWDPVNALVTFITVGGFTDLNGTTLQSNTLKFQLMASNLFVPTSVASYLKTLRGNLAGGCGSRSCVWIGGSFGCVLFK